jgi:hypothetical protein
MDAVWKSHLEALTRFNRWEAGQLRSRSQDFGESLAWLSDAWEVADRYGAREDPAMRRERHLRELIELRRALEKARLRP